MENGKYVEVVITMDLASIITHILKVYNVEKGISQES